MASWVGRAKPVVRTTVRPSDASRSTASRAPGTGAMRLASTSSPYASSKAVLARWALSSPLSRPSPSSLLSLPSPAKRCRKTEILDSPMVART